MGTPSLNTVSDYQNLTFIKFWDAYARFHLTDMLEISITLLNTLSDTGDEGKHKRRYLKELSLYYISMQDALKFWYDMMAITQPRFSLISCPFDKGCIELINIVRYSRRPVIVDRETEEKYVKYEVETYFKHMKAHILDVIVKTSSFFTFDINDLNKSNETDLPPEIIKK